MSKKFIRLYSIVTCLSLAVGTMAGCTSSDDKKDASDIKNGKPTELTILWDPDNAVKSGVDLQNSQEIKFIEEKTNTKLTLIQPPHSEFKQKATIIFASGDLPDIAKMESEPKREDLADMGVIVQLDDLLKKYGQNILKNANPQAWEFVKVKGTTWGIPTARPVTKPCVNMIRKDWLDNLGLKVPRTIDEYFEVLKAFTYNDPDKNGKNDTWGTITRKGFDWFESYNGAFGIIKDINTNAESTDWVWDGNRLIPQYITTNWRDWVAEMSKLWKAGVFEPNSMVNSREQFDQAIINGKVGMWFYYPNLSYTTYYEPMKKLNPKAEFIPIAPPVGKDGKSTGAPDRGQYYRRVYVTTGCKTPEKAVQFLDWFFTDEGDDFLRYGFEGRHHKIVNGKKVLDYENYNKPENFWLYDDISLGGKHKLDWDYEASKFSPEIGKYVVEGYKIGMATGTDRSTAIEGKPQLQSDKDYPDIDKIKGEYRSKMIVGQLPISAFDQMVNDVMKAGLDKKIEEYTKWYKENKLNQK